MHVEYVSSARPSPTSRQSEGYRELKRVEGQVKAEVQKIWATPMLTGRLKAIIITFTQGISPPSTWTTCRSQYWISCKRSSTTTIGRSRRRRSLTFDRCADVHRWCVEILVDACGKDNSSYTFGSRTPLTHSHSRSDVMDFNQEVMKIVKQYAGQGYEPTSAAPRICRPSRETSMWIFSQTGDRGVLSSEAEPG